MKFLAVLPLLAAAAMAAPAPGLLAAGVHPVAFQQVHHVQVPVTKTVHYDVRNVVTGYSTSILKPAIAQPALVGFGAPAVVAAAPGASFLPLFPFQQQNQTQIPQFPGFPQQPQQPQFPQPPQGGAEQIPQIPGVPAFPGQPTTTAKPNENAPNDPEQEGSAGSSTTQNPAQIPQFPGVPAFPAFPTQAPQILGLNNFNTLLLNPVVAAPAPVPAAPVQVAAPVAPVAAAPAPEQPLDDDTDIVEARSAPVAAAAPVAVAPAPQVQVLSAAPQIALQQPVQPWVSQEKVLAPVRTHTQVTPQITQIQPEVTVRKVVHDVPVATPVLGQPIVHHQFLNGVQGVHFL